MVIIKRLLTGLALITIFSTLFFYAPSIYFSLLLTAIAFYILCVEWPNLGSKRLSWMIIGILYCGIPFAALILLNQSNTYRILLPLLFGLVFAHDTGAYIFGRLFGKHKIAPNISPKKTWEGFIGGLITTNALLFSYAWYHNKTISWYIFIIGIVITLCATAGDLFESWLKRRAGVKDSGSILPGHGGLLDRFDSVLPLAMLFYFLRTYLY